MVQESLHNYVNKLEITKSRGGGMRRGKGRESERKGNQVRVRAERSELEKFLQKTRSREYP